jgi:hypothetical protein
VCHGPNATPGGRGSNAPNLTTSPFLHSQAGFDQIVLQGARVDRGMLDFRGKLSSADSAAVLAYVVSRANEVKNNPPAPGGFGGPGGPPRGPGAGPGGAPGAPGAAPGAIAPPARPATPPVPAPQVPRDVHEEAASPQR